MDRLTEEVRQEASHYVCRRHCDLFVTAAERKWKEEDLRLPAARCGTSGCTREQRFKEVVRQEASSQGRQRVWK